MNKKKLNWKSDSFYIKLIRFTLSLILAILLFSIIPFAHVLFTRQDRSLETIAKTAPVVIQKKSEEKKPVERMQRNIRSLSSRSSNRSMKFTMRFSPDLGIGGGDGVSVGGDGIGTSVFDESEVDEPPKPLTRMAISYPRRAKEAEIEGVVSLLILIGRTGSVTSVSVESSPSPLFDKPIMEAIKKWKFSPAKNGGVPVQVRMRQNITFNLEN